MITQVIQRYYPNWPVPTDNGKEWVYCLCPFHGDERESAAISFERDAFNCLACDWAGDAYTIIKRKEGVDFGEAIRIAEGISATGGNSVRGETARKSSRGTSEGAGLVGRRPSRGNSKVPSRVRRRPSTGL